MKEMESRKLQKKLKSSSGENRKQMQMGTILILTASIHPKLAWNLKPEMMHTISSASMAS